MHRSILSVMFVLGLTSCAAPGAQREPYNIHQSFDFAQWAPYDKPGSGSVEGQAFLRQNGGGVVTCAGADVSVFPATPYVQEGVEAVLRAPYSSIANRATVIEPKTKAYERHTLCDAQGNFRIDGLPAGPWYVSTVVTWSVAGQPQGGTLIKAFTAADDTVAKVLLTDADRIK